MKENVQNKLISIREAIFDPAQKNPKLRIVFLIFNIVFVLFALMMMIIGTVVSLSTKSYNFLPPILAAAGLFLLLTVPLGLYGIYYKSAKPSRRFIAIQLYLFLTLFLSLALILLGGFFIVFYPSLQAKVSMRWDVFVDVLNENQKHPCSKNQELVDKFCAFLRTGGVFSILSGILLLASPIITLFLIGWKLYMNSLYLVGSALMIIFGGLTSAVGLYLLSLYSHPDQTRFTMPKSAPAIYMMIGCGVLPIVIGILGIVLGFQKKSPTGASMFIFEIGLVLVIALLFATGGYFISTYMSTAQVEIRAYLKVNQAWVGQAMLLRKCFLNETTCALDTCGAAGSGVEVDDPDSESYQKLLDWLVGCFSSRVNADFFLCGFSGVAVAIFALLMAVSFALDLLHNFIKNFGKEEEEEDEDKDDDDA